jgi:hypothetical protein
MSRKIQSQTTSLLSPAAAAPQPAQMLTPLPTAAPSAQLADRRCKRTGARDALPQPPLMPPLAPLPPPPLPLAPLPPPLALLLPPLGLKRRCQTASAPAVLPPSPAVLPAL